MAGGTDLTGDLLWRVEFIGQRGGGEIFDHGMWVDQPGTLATADDILDTAVVFLSAYLASSSIASGTDMQHCYSDDVHWTEIRATRFTQATGLPVGVSTPRANSVSGLGGFSPMPLQVAMVASWWNGSSIGRFRYNRSFLPGPSASFIGSDARFSSSLCGDVVTGLAAANAAAALATVPWSVAYYSLVNHSFLSLESVIVDDVPDTQRRRRDQLVPVKHSASL